MQQCGVLTFYGSLTLGLGSQIYAANTSPKNDSDSDTDSRLKIRLQLCCLSFNSYFTWCNISVLSRGISMKLVTKWHHDRTCLRWHDQQELYTSRNLVVVGSVYNQWVVHGKGGDSDSGPKPGLRFHTPGNMVVCCVLHPASLLSDVTGLLQPDWCAA